MATFWATFGFVVGILRFQKCLDLNVLDFQIELWCRYSDIFGLWDSLGYFKKN